jgi:hypothetical protein
MTKDDRVGGIFKKECSGQMDNISHASKHK